MSLSRRARRAVARGAGFNRVDPHCRGKHTKPLHCGIGKQISPRGTLSPQSRTKALQEYNKSKGGPDDGR